MIKKIGKSLPSNSLNYLVIFGGIIVILILLGILPFHRYNSNRAQEVKKIQADIAEQKEFQQAYQSQQKISKTPIVHKLPNPVKTKLPRPDLDKFQDTFRAEAKKSGLIITSLIPDMATLAAGSPAILFDVTTKGQFANFRKLLINVGALPYVDKIEEINIKQLEDSMEFKMKLWIVLAN